MKVEVELEDLETLLFATVVIKQIENALAAYKRDPFVKPHLMYGDALKNLTGVMNSAKRGSSGTLIDWNGALTSAEAKFLRDVNELFNQTSRYYEITGEDKREHIEIDQLASKGCINIGQSITGVIWSGDNAPSIRPVPTFQVKLTDRGQAKLKAYESSSVGFMGESRDA